ncbi:thiamine pyrophosphate-dependent enzyme [Magnetospirillum sp. UT-4]|uniref:thiamine pyrophosphate-dependent enzyme n=1 Tax=Magnetospirillum sp. UT-4 TaxID=2681467 RepID=UPI001383B11D|nr:thiamine pyrophosphate-dependent enzyme [Magnetospirillum sp. UT-4]CAA7621645.1 Transketolase domain protein [Magnetospirillum sp. UT-4]
MISNSFDPARSAERCRRYRRRVLEVSQRVQALHIATAFSCTEIVDAVYNGLKTDTDTFLMSKGHGAIMQYVVLEDLGVLPKHALDNYCTSGGMLGAHPDCGNPGIAASTGSLGHGLAMAVGMALAESVKGGGGLVHCLLGDGELHEGSTWEAVLLAASLGASNLVAYVDANGWQSCSDRTRDTHPALYPLAPKFAGFGWQVAQVDGHDGAAMVQAVRGRDGTRPMMLVCDTVKGKGVSFMADSVAWHYKRPKPDEFAAAMAELA